MLLKPSVNAGKPEASNLSDQGPKPAAPLTFECAEPGALISGLAYLAGPVPQPTVDGAMWLAAELVFGEKWPSGHSHGLGLPGPDGTFRWRNQADGTFEP